MRGKKSVGKGVIVGRKRRRQKIYRKQRSWGFPIGLLASAAARFLGERAKPILKKVFSGRRRRPRDKKLLFDDDLSH